MPPRLELVRDWLIMAQKDLSAARMLLKGDPPLLEAGCFHCQQALEKAFKAILLHNEQRPPRTHNLADLIGLCERWAKGLAEYESRCSWLTACAVDARYPDNSVDLTPESADDALATTEEVFAFVLKHIPPEAHP